MTDVIKEQIAMIRESGAVNMFDLQAVQNLAYECEFYELVIYIAECKAAYVKYLFTGKAEQ